MSQERPDFFHPIGYSIIKRPFFRFNFPGLEEIQINHSQLHQDMFVLTALNGKREGHYLEIGAHEPVFLSNTCLLERSFGWKGLGLEINPDLVARHKRQRRNPCIAGDALAADYERLLMQHAFPEVIDYLSLDIDPPANTLAALQKIPHQSYRFRVITFEHDYSLGGHHEREQSRIILKDLGYELLINDISWNEHIVEDWWIHPELVDDSIASSLRQNNPSIHRHDLILYAAPASADGGDGNRIQNPGPAEIQAPPASQPSGLCIEGWRQLNHSYSLVNQWQLLALLERPIRIRHRDLPPLSSTWNQQSYGSGLPAELAQRIATVEQPGASESFEATYRISFPLDFTPTEHGRLFVFGTAEYGLTSDMVKGASLESAIANENLEIITPSQWSRQGFLLSGFAAERVHVIPHAAAADAFHRVAPDLRSLYRQIFGFHEEDQVLLNLGALTTNKGFDLLLAAYASLKPSHPHLKLVVKNQSTINSRTIGTVISEMIFHGRGPIPASDAMKDIIIIDENLDLETLRALYNACDIYASPYRAEGFNLPALEAAACGLPILVTAGGSSDDYFVPELGLQIASDLHRWEGMRVLSPSLDSLISGIEQLLARPQHWGGEKGSQWVHDHYSWQGIGTDLLRVIGLG